jgi:hypothetical protein
MAQSGTEPATFQSVAQRVSRRFVTKSTGIRCRVGYYVVSLGRSWLPQDVLVERVNVIRKMIPK